MTGPTVTPFGEWPSPITAASLVSGAVGISECCVDGDDVWWAEARPDEGGRTALIRWRDGAAEEVTPADTYVRTLVHEYGGGSWWVHNGVAYYVDLSDQRLRRLAPGREPVFLTAEPDAPRRVRFADFRIDAEGSFVIAVRETHHDDREPTNDLVAIPTDGSMEMRDLWGGTDFVSSPRLSPDGTQLAWVSWSHPNMPWDSTRLHVAPYGDGSIGEVSLELGNGAEAWAEPGWTPDGRLLACTDRDEWWNLVSVEGATAPQSVVTGPFEVATPGWVFGMQRWAVTADHTVAAVGLATGDELIVDGRTISMPDATISSLQPASDGVVYVGTGYGHEPQVVKLFVDGPNVRRQVLSTGRELPVEPGYLIEPESIVFPTGDG
ncbi:MAG: TolB family protein, partial [Acidimicrobiales bacterium]